jgi:maleylpyruvate isomerase
MNLQSFFRSGTSHRLRITLDLEGLAYNYVTVHFR